MFRNETAPDEIRQIATMLKNGVPMMTIAKGLKKDPSNFRKEVNRWRKDYPLLFI